MNILYFCQLYPPSIFGGGEFIFYQWAKELAKRGHNIYTITQRLEGENDFEAIDGIHVIRVGPAIKYRGSLPTSFFANLGYLLEAAFKGISIGASKRIDIIHSNTYVPPFAGQICASILGKPHVVTFHDVYFYQDPNFWKKWGEQKRVDGTVSFLGPLIEKLVMRLRASVFHTVSTTSMKDLMANGVKKVVVIPNGLELVNYDTAQDRPIIPNQAVFIGRLVFYKNLDTVILSMKQVIETDPEAKLLIIGSGPYKGNLETLVKKENLENNVILIDAVSEEKKLFLLHQSAFLVLPSVCEGFGIVVIEAFACKKPALVSQVMPLPELVRNNETGYCIAPFDVQAWARSLRLLFENPIEVTRMGKLARKEVEAKYTIKVVVDKFEGLYRELIN